MKLKLTPVTVAIDGRPYFFQVVGAVIDGKPFIATVLTDTGNSEYDHEIPFVMLDWKESMFYAIERSGADGR